MGMTTSIVYGYGVDGDVLYKIATEKLVAFLKKHLPVDYATMMEDLEDLTENKLHPEERDYEEWLDGCSCINSGIEGKYSIISTAISEETGIRFEYQHSSERNECAVLLTERLPWHMNVKEKNATQESLDEILKRYFLELGVDVVPAIVSVEYYG